MSSTYRSNSGQPRSSSVKPAQPYDMNSLELLQGHSSDAESDKQPEASPFEQWVEEFAERFWNHTAYQHRMGSWQLIGRLPKQ